MYRIRSKCSIRTFSSSKILFDSKQSGSRDRFPRKLKKNQKEEKENFLGKAEAMAMLNALNKIQDKTKDFNTLMNTKKSEKNEEEILNDLRVKLLTNYIQPGKHLLVII
jgi:hypothetical protein